MKRLTSGVERVLQPDLVEGPGKWSDGTYAGVHRSDKRKYESPFMQGINDPPIEFSGGSIRNPFSAGILFNVKPPDWPNMDYSEGGIVVPLRRRAACDHTRQKLTEGSRRWRCMDCGAVL